MACILDKQYIKVPGYSLAVKMKNVVRHPCNFPLNQGQTEFNE
jgi:hypothetical protein